MFARRYFAGRYFPKKFFPASVTTAVTTPKSTTAGMDAAVSLTRVTGVSLDAVTRVLDAKASAQLDAFIFDGSAVLHLDRIFRPSGTQIKRARTH